MARLKLNLSYRWWNVSSPNLEDNGGVVGKTSSSSYRGH